MAAPVTHFDRNRVYNVTQFYGFLDKWKPQSEILPLRYGDNVPAGLGALTGYYTVFYFRKFLKVSPSHKLSMYPPTVVLPGFGLLVVHTGLVNAHIVEGTVDPVGLTATVVCGQLFFGTIFPIVLAGLTSFYAADRGLTYPVPPLLSAPKECLNLFKKIIKPRAKFLGVMSVVQVAAALTVTEMKKTNFEFIKPRFHQGIHLKQQKM